MTCKCEYKFNRNSIEKNVTRIKSGIKITIGVNVQIQLNIMPTKYIIFGILLHVLVKMVDVQEVLLTVWELYVMKL